MKKEFSKEEVIEILDDYHIKRGMNKNGFTDFLKEKGLLEEELEKGTWYKCKWEGKVGFICNQGYNETNKTNTGYGFNYGCEWSNFIGFSKPYRKAEKHEIEPLLIAEAKRRGLVEGVDAECAYDNEQETVRSHNELFEEEGTLWSHSTLCLFYEGKWAKPIVQEEMTFKAICKELGRTIKIVE